MATIQWRNQGVRPYVWMIWTNIDLFHIWGLKQLWFVSWMHWLEFSFALKMLLFCFHFYILNTTNIKRRAQNLEVFDCRDWAPMAGTEPNRVPSLPWVIWFEFFRAGFFFCLALYFLQLSIWCPCCVISCSFWKKKEFYFNFFLALLYF